MVSAFLSWRRRPGSDLHPRAELADKPDYGGDYTNVEDRLMLSQALARLPRRQRATLILRYYEDLDVEGVALAMGCSPGTVKSQTSKALANLRTTGLILVEATRETHDVR